MSAIPTQSPPLVASQTGANVVSSIAQYTAVGATLAVGALVMFKMMNMDEKIVELEKDVADMRIALSMYNSGREQTRAKDPFSGQSARRERRPVADEIDESSVVDLDVEEGQEQEEEQEKGAEREEERGKGEGDVSTQSRSKREAFSGTPAEQTVADASRAIVQKEPVDATEADDTDDEQPPRMQVRQRQQKRRMT